MQNVLVLGAVAGAGLLYVRVWRGWRLSDLMIITRASLQQSVGAVTQGACRSAQSPPAGQGART